MKLFSQIMPFSTWFADDALAEERCHFFQQSKRDLWSESCQITSSWCKNSLFCNVLSMKLIIDASAFLVLSSALNLSRFSSSQIFTPPYPFTNVFHHSANLSLSGEIFWEENDVWFWCISISATVKSDIQSLHESIFWHVRDHKH